MIDKILYSLKSGGKCVLNVGHNRYPIDKDIVSYLADSYQITCRRLTTREVGGTIGGSGIGARTGEGGEPFIYFEKAEPNG